MKSDGEEEERGNQLDLRTTSDAAAAAAAADASSLERARAPNLTEFNRTTTATNHHTLIEALVFSIYSTSFFKAKREKTYDGQFKFLMSPH